jgi:RNA polymerase sigma factor (sigma-70 family)
MTTAEELLAHAEWVQRVARALLGDRGGGADADDLTQDVLAAAVERPPPEGAAVGGWLAGVARNLSRLGWRTRTRRQRREADAHADRDAVPTPEQLVARAQAHQTLTRILLALDEPLRTTVLLRFYEGLSSAEIARRLRVPAGTVRWRLQRALDELRERLEANGLARKSWALLFAPLHSVPGAAIVKGAVLMKGLQIAAGVALALLLGWLGVGVVRGRAAHAPRATGAGAAPTHHAQSPAALPMRAAAAARDPDPAGRLRLEGQVVDDQEQPVAGADVALDASPPRTARSGPDGAFVFTDLIARDYRVEARTSDGYASTVELRLTATSDPIILRIARAGTLDVEVRDAARGTPVAGAAVELRSMLTWTGRSDDAGRARLTGVGAGWPSLHVTAPGYAPAAMMVRTSGDPRRVQRQVVTLARGAAVSGRVLDPGGRPVAGAKIIAELAAEPFPVLDASRDGVTSGADGAFKFESLAAGSYRFVAFHDEYAPSTTPPLALDGTHPAERVEVRMTAGAVLRGVVVGDGGRPIPTALVRLTGVGSISWRLSREAFTDAHGRFALRGLPARAVDVAATCDEGSTELVRVDLAAGPTSVARDVTLAIANRGALEGAVVGSDGAGVPEAQVLAEPERTGMLGEREAWEARGVGSVVADGGGRFRFAGLPSGAYRVRAVRPGHSDDALHLAPPVAAATGDRDVRVTVPADGRVRGKIAYKDGGTPDLYTVEIDAVRPEPFSSPDGAFELAATGGAHDVVVTGPTFARTRVANVAVREGAATDVGTIVVEKGRTVSGRVLDASGAPVAGAAVAGGLLLTGNGSQLNVPSEGYRVQETESDAAGRYVLRGFGEHAIVLVAERAGAGRAASVRVPPGPSSVEVDLVLQPTGSLGGKVTRDGQPLVQVVVIAKPRGARDSNFFVLTGEDGSYAFDSLAAGDYAVFPMLGGGNIQPKDMFLSAVTVVPGQRATADLSARYGGASLTVHVVGENGAPVGAALVLVVAGAVTSPTMDALFDGTWLAPGQGVAAYQRTAIGAAGARIDGMFAGAYSACVTPLPVDPNDRAAMIGIRDQVGALPMRCVSAQVRDERGQAIEVRAGK